MAAAESSTLKPLDSISVNQEKIAAVKKIVEITEQQEKQAEIPEDIPDDIPEESPEEIKNSEIEPEIQLKQAIESDEDYVYEEEPEDEPEVKDYSSEYMVNDAIEYPTLIDEEPEELDDSFEAEAAEDIANEVAGALTMSHSL